MGTWVSVIIALLVAMECLEVGLNTLSKSAMRGGMSSTVFVVYSNAMAILFLLPSTFICHRIKPCPQPSFSIVCRIFILGLISCSAQILMYIGIRYSSPTVASAMTGLTPGLTFILATLTGMEKLDLKAQSSQAKSIGAIISIAGAFIVTFYQGPPIMFSGSLSNVLPVIVPLPRSNWIIGSFLLATVSFLVALSYIVQTWVLKDYPAGLMVTLIGCIFVTIQSAIVALIAERNPNAWKVRLDVELVTIAYSAILMVAIRSVVHTWALRKKGPVFVTMFKPLGMVVAVVMGVTFLGDSLHVGRILGAVIIALGFYSVMWGKAKEVMIIEDNDISGFNSSSDKVPLLQNRSMEV